MKNGKIQGWIIYPEYVAHKKDNAFGWLRDEAAICGIELHIVIIENLRVEYGNGSHLYCNGHEVLELPDFVIIRTYDSVVTRFFEHHGIQVINSSHSMELCKNKMLTHEILTANGIPTPLTIYSPQGHYDYNILCGEFGANEFVAKRTDGAKGEDVYLVSSAEELEHAVQRCAGNCICQRFIRSSYGRDVRMWVLDGEVIGSVLRVSNTSFISNYSQGGLAQQFTPPTEAIQLAVQSAQALGVRFSGIDLLFGDNGFIVNEVNGNAGFRTLSLVGDNSLPHKLFSRLRESSLNQTIL